MSLESRSLPRSVLAVLCAAVLAAGMALPMLGAMPSYAGEVNEPIVETVASENALAAEDDKEVESLDKMAPATEASEDEMDEGAAFPSGGDSEIQPLASNSAETYTVTFGANAPQSVVKGESAVAPTNHSAQLRLNGKTVPGTFLGWYKLKKPDNMTPAEFSETDGFGVNDCVPAYYTNEYEDEVMFVTDQQATKIRTYPTSSSIPISADTTFRALYQVPVNVVSVGIYYEGEWAATDVARVINGDPLISDEFLQYDLSRGFVVENCTFAGEPFDVNTSPINTDLIARGPDADGHAKSLVQIYFTKNPGEDSLVVSGSTGIAASGNLKGSNIPKNATTSLGASSISSGEFYNDLMSKVGNGVLAGVYEVSLAVNGSLVHNEFGNLTLSFPVDEQYNGHWITIYHRHNDGSITSERVIAEGGMVTVTVTDLSTFALEVGELAESESSGTEGTGTETNPSALAATGDSLAGITIATVAAIALGTVGFAGYRSRKIVKK